MSSSALLGHASPIITPVIAGSNYFRIWRRISRIRRYGSNWSQTCCRGANGGFRRSRKGERCRWNAEKFFLRLTLQRTHTRPRASMSDARTISSDPSASAQSGSGVGVPRLVRRCFNCRHASKYFNLPSGTHHHCLHPQRFDGIEEPSPWDSLVEWYSLCKKWEAKP